MEREGYRGKAKARGISVSGEKAMRRALKITVIYFIFGCAWILSTDWLSGWLFPNLPAVMTASLIKGLFYVLITSALIYLLAFPSLRKILKSEESIKEINAELEKTSAKYKGLYEEYGKKEALLKSMVNSIPDLIFYKDTESSYLGCNKAYMDFIGKTEAEIIGHNDYDIYDRERADHFRASDTKIFGMNLTVKREDFFSVSDGTSLYFETLKTPYYDMDGNIIGLIGISRDITQRKEKEDEILFLNRHDILTGLYNRAVFEEKLTELDSEENLPLSVIMGDINGLRLINDSFGQKQGDRFIAEIAGILKDCCGENSVVSRIGGDEFAMLLPRTGNDEVKAVVDNIKESCEKRHAETGEIFYLTNISLGCATKTDPCKSLMETIRAAEEYMFRHKLFEEKSQHNSILSSIKSTMFEKSCETEEHAERMGEMAKKLGKALGLADNDIEALELLSTLHDIGKISVDKRILTKSGQLTDEEWHEIRRHPEVGYRICQASPEFVHVSEYILSHHERWDGGGYPQGLKAEEIPLLSRIISLVDAYDAMTQDRAYRKALPPEKAVEEIMRGAGTQFDPRIAYIFIEQVINQ